MESTGRIGSAGAEDEAGAGAGTDGKAWYANVTVTEVGWNDCWIDQTCSTTIPCVGQYSDGYCSFDGETQVESICWYCPEDPFDCFFPSTGTGVQNEVESCASSCAANIEFGTNCKLCGDGFSADSFEFGVESEEDKCSFCPNQDLEYPNRDVPLFAAGREKYEMDKPENERGVKCWQVQSFFDKVDVPSDSKNCRLAQLQNYICGCEGPGYAGANTETMRRALVWAPRVMAILSFLVSVAVSQQMLHILRSIYVIYSLRSFDSFSCMLHSIAGFILSCLQMHEEKGTPRQGILPANDPTIPV